MPLPPQLDPAQRQAALEKAAAARRQRAELKEKLKAGSISLGELLQRGDLKSGDVVALSGISIGMRWYCTLIEV